MPEIKYLSPDEARERGELGQHHFDLILEGKKVGSAELDYLSKPLPLYQLTDLYVDSEHQGKHYASEIMDQVEAWLKGRRKPGVLVDAIDEGSPAFGMYEKRGWTPVPDVEHLYVFNWPKDVDLKILKGYPLRYTFSFERPSYIEGK